MIEEVMQIMNQIHYGYLDSNGKNITEKDPENWDIEFERIYRLLAPEELLEKKYGTCYDQVELERKLLEDRGISSQSFFIAAHESIDCIYTHTFLVYEKDNCYYWMEHSWINYRGVSKYSSLKDLLLDVKEKFRKSHLLEHDTSIFVYEYERPCSGVNSHEFFEYCENSTLVKLNEPLYFYHVVDKGVDLSKGLFSLKYMYEHNLFSLFDHFASKYKKGIVSYWNLSKYKGRKEDSLTREEILDALNLFRGNYCSSYIYFFRYPPYQELGTKMKNLLDGKDIYRINMNDEEIEKCIQDIFWGYEGNHGDGKLLTKKYYETVTPKEYFSNYKDSDERNFANLNHIAVSFFGDYCPITFLEKVDSD